MSRRLDPEDLDHPVGADADDLEGADAAEFLNRIEDLLATTRYEWASDTLTGIYSTVEETQRVTAGQRRAVQNIEEAGWK